MPNQKILSHLSKPVSIIEVPAFPNEGVLVMGFHSPPDEFYTFEINKGMSNYLDRRIVGELDQFGFAYIPVEIENPANGLFVSSKAIIDTGASNCLLKMSVINELHLESIRTNEYRHPQYGLMPTDDYLISLIIDIHNESGSAKLKEVRAGVIHDDLYPCDIIIGIQLLRHCRVYYDGIEKKFQIQFYFNE